SAVALATNDSNNARLFLVRISDGSVRPLTDRSWRSIRGLTWLHDSSGLIVSATDKDYVLQQLWSVGRSDGEARRLTTDLSVYYGLTSFRSSNDSILTISGVNQSNIWTSPANDLANSKQITFGSPGQNAGWNGLAWTADGRIVYSSENSAGVSLW